MRKMIYNTKLKKIFTGLIVIVILCGYILPIKVCASPSDAENLQKVLQSNDFGTPTISITKCQEIINEIENADKGNNKVTSSTDENGNVIIYISVTEKDIVKNVLNKVLKENMGDYIEANFYDFFAISIGRKEEINNSETENQKENNFTSVAQVLQNVLNDNASTLGKYNTTLSQCQNIINRIEKSDTRNKVTSNNDGINISAISYKTIIDAFQYEGGYEQSISELIAKNNYSFLTVDIIDPNNITEGEEDTRTDEQKIIDAIVSKYPSISPESARIIVENNKYEITKNEEGKITDVKLNLTQDEMNAYGISDEAQKDIYDEQKEESSVDLGGILLGPVFSLVNYVADAVISITGSIMYPEKQDLDFGLGVLTNKKPQNPGYTKTYTQNVTTDSFLPTNFWGKIFFKGASIKYQYPHLYYTPEEIFSGKVELLSIDFVTGKSYDRQPIKDDGWKNIRKVISQWYQVLRMIAIVGLLSVLIYTGIKIMISANAKDKAKYKEWIVNWLMAVAILFFMHYIMAFIVSVIGEFSKLMTEASQGIHVIPSDNEANAFDTNLMGLVRFMIQSDNFYMKVGYEIMYIALIWYTLKFTITYLKRVLNMAFLTLIAPIVALTYPIDKISDGKAQGFDMWLKEYIFNALLQPMHCILYYILVGSAVEIAANNPLYGIAVLTFMSQAENLLKKIFGFDKARGGTVGGMANAFAAGAIASNITKMTKLPKGSSGKGEDGDEDDNLYKNLKPTEKDSDKDDSLFNMSDADRNYLNELEKERSTNPNWSEEDEKALKELKSEYGVTANNTSQTRGRGTEETPNDGQNSGQNRGQSTTPQVRNSSNNASATPVRSMAGRVGRGAMAVGKRLAKPIWDFDHGGKYNGKRLIRKAGRATLGASLGVAAAAVQAGISITDGKYNPMEGMASFAAGYAGAGQIAKGMRSLGETYKQGTLPDDPDQRKKELMKRAQKEWGDREDVIKHNKNKYSSDERKHVVDYQKQLLAQGVTDLNEMDKCIKYAKSLNNGNLEGIPSDKIRRARVMHDCSGDSNMQKAAYDPSFGNGYVDSVAKDDREKRIIKNQLNELVKYNDIVNKK